MVVLYSFMGDINSLDELADSELRGALKKILTPGGIVLDVGANRGQFALDVLSVQTCKIFCFEPLPDAFRYLQILQDSHPQINPVQLAVSNVSGEAEFHVTAGDVGSSLLAPMENQGSQWQMPIPGGGSQYKAHALMNS
jgi:hypothetical protein